MSQNYCIDTARVVSIKKGTLFVSLERTPACNGCKSCVFGKKSDIVVPAKNTVNATIGDHVRVSMLRNSKTSLLSILVGLGIPLICLLLGIVISSLCGVKEWISVLIGVGTALAGFFITIPIDRAFLRSKYGCEIVEILDEAELREQSANQL